MRWHLFPEIRIPQKQIALFEEEQDLMKVLDMQQEQLARSLGEGHRVIHGVAGSGKTLILGYRAEHLARVCAKPILVLCYNKTLAQRLTRLIEAKKLTGKVVVRNFHRWAFDQLNAYHAGLPPKLPDANAWYAAMIQKLIESVDRGLVPKAQYDAVLIDEGHDFEPQWLKLVVQMVDPRANSLLVLYDDAQSIYAKASRPKFSFKSVGIQAAGRTTILKVNYRNTQEILELAKFAASGLLKAKDSDEDGVPVLAPVGAGRHGPEPLTIKLPTLKDEGAFIADKFHAAHKEGLPWKDMAVVYHDYRAVGGTVLASLRARGIPVTFHKDATFAESEDTVKFLTMHSCKGLEFPLVAIPGTKALLGDPKEREQRARLLYVAMTRATRQLIVMA